MQKKLPRNKRMKKGFPEQYVLEALEYCQEQHERRA
jgi:hypothetical protein